MDNQSLLNLAKQVHQFCGLNYLNNLSSFELKIKRRMQALNLTSIAAYRTHLEKYKFEWDALIQEVTINETYFFREDKQLYVYQQKILPELSKAGQAVRVWSAACSSGEEPYTLACLSVDSGIQLNNQLQIIGTDINSKVLNIAKSGEYLKTSLSFRRLEQYWLNTYFDENENTYKIKENIQDLVDFHYINLNNIKLIEQQQQCDVIFCRNVLIYFDEATIEKIIRAFYKVLKPGGYLFLGHAEIISQVKDIGFEAINDSGTFYYRKG